MSRGVELEPLLLPDGFEGHPLRKEFVLASRVAKAVARCEGAGRERRRLGALAEPSTDQATRRPRRLEGCRTAEVDG